VRERGILTQVFSVSPSGGATSNCDKCDSQKSDAQQKNDYFKPIHTVPFSAIPFRRHNMQGVKKNVTHHVYDMRKN